MSLSGFTYKVTACQENAKIILDSDSSCQITYGQPKKEF